MGRRPTNSIGICPAEEPPAIKEPHLEREPAVDGLRELRQLAGKAQADVATALNIKQPSVSKIEKQTDMHLSTLRNYVEAVGGKLELTVKLPRRPALRIQHLGDIDVASLKSANRLRGRAQNGGDCWC